MALRTWQETDIGDEFDSVCLQRANKLLDCSSGMSDCPNFRHLLITRPDVLKSRIGSAFSKIPKWFTCEVIVPFVITRLALLLVGWLGVRLLPLPVAFPSAWEIGPDGNRRASSITFLQLLIPGSYSQWNWVA